MKTNKVIVFLICISMLFTLCGCASKTAITAEMFTKTMEAENFTIKDATNQTETNGLANAVILAVCEDYQIEFYELIDDKTGEGVFYTNKQLFDNRYSVKTMSVGLNFGNYNYYAFNADGKFHMIARIDNTMLWCEADDTYKNDIVDLVKKLGYK